MDIRRFMSLLVLLFALPAMMTQARADAPDSSGAVDRLELPWSPAFEDPQAALVVLLGPPPDEGEVCVDFGVGDFTFIETPSGALMYRSTGRFTAYVYTGSSVEEVCDAVLTAGLEPIAVGDDITVVRRDNFLNYEPGSRTNVFSRSAQGIVYDAHGDAWGLHAFSWQQLDRQGDYSWRETVRLNAHGG